MKELIVQKQISINVPKSTVWKTLTEPKLTKKYFFGCRINSSFIVDDPIIFERKILGLFPFELTGKVLEINRGSMLKYSLKISSSKSESIVKIDLNGENGKTLVSVTDDVGQGKGSQGRYNRSVKGWDKILTGLKRVAEKYANQN